ncbi:hypothetical protein [Pseudalkalibacillus berkeleyi]|uniref:Uncharacterized protein n=1 Tax=Pseudalkalibacillus berkeleyi TaxID=1069813 RepID=A0ABS9H1I0_9BACL|nr:hypothetical protein [Pseudalkalibacillus berkeleyi]MCF6137759.1 hypothetical protein [Pseudalkalibacillus berkeleyi]
MKAEKLCNTITNLDVKPGGTLRFYGKWFGRPYDNYHKVIECSFNDGILQFIFDAGEQLKIWNPNKIVFNYNKLVIKESSCVDFIRYPYGEPHTDENLVIDRYSNRQIFNNSIKSGKVCYQLLDENYPAVELLSY